MEQNIAGIATPWVAGEWVFVVTDEAADRPAAQQWPGPLDQPAAAVGESEGKKGRSSFGTGAGRRPPDRRLVGTLINVNPDNGSFQSQINIGGGVSPPPVVAGSTLYILDGQPG